MMKPACVLCSLLLLGSIHISTASASGVSDTEQASYADKHLLFESENVTTTIPETVNKTTPETLTNTTTETVANTTTETVANTTTETVTNTTTETVTNTTAEIVTITTPETTNSTPGGNGTGDSVYPEYVGFITAGIAVVFYGSNFVPVKKFDTGDGMFFQWIMCGGIWLTGVILQIVRHSEFYPLVMVGGLIWGTGNICVVPIIKTIGMGLGLCIWGLFNLLAGWASGRFGWFGITPEVPSHVTLNYAGVALAVASTVIYVFVKNEITMPSVEMTVQVDEEREPLAADRANLYGGNPQEDVLVFNKRRSSSISLTEGPASSDHSFIDKLTPGNKRIVGLSLSVFSGVLYGLNFAPAIYVQDHHKDPSSKYYGSSQNSLDYVFAQYCGIYLTSTVYFLIYAAFKKNKPMVYPKVILPAVASGLMWGVATACWFISNKALSEPVAFPIITTGPGALASLFWGVCIFREIRGKRNILILLLAFVVTTAGSIMAGLSKS